MDIDMLDLLPRRSWVLVTAHRRAIFYLFDVL